MNVQVILKENYPSLGYIGDTVSVRAGYARNFLIPRGIAVESLSRNAAMLKHQMAGIMAKRKKMRSEAEKLAEQLKGLTLEFTLKSGEKGRSFGSITAKDIETALQQRGFQLDRKQIRLADALRRAGEYEASVKLHAEVQIPIAIVLKVEAPVVSEEGGKARGRRSKKTAEVSKEGQPESEAAAPSAESPESH
ncbi:MAG: 50S ribosomal protein L9 [Bdellovibrionota bacterium]|nr:MAG: 50S ribosomal protein L9 [Bdellovibrionota bacterium]